MIKDYSVLKYMHVERLGTDEVEGLLNGTVYVFPKIDGTNGVIWYEDGEVKAGSRNRELTLDKDNAGFYKWVLSQDNIRDFMSTHNNLVLYGEWLVPHTIKTYRENCWRKFYIFDVGVRTDNGIILLPYSNYKDELQRYNLEFLPPLAIIKNPTIEKIKEYAEGNFYLMTDGNVGEGVVRKNYSFYNRYGRQVWGKLVRNEFKEKHKSTFGTPVIELLTVEDKIVAEYVTQTLIDKEYEKIKVSEGGWQSKFIPRLLQTVYYTLITEESWNFIKQFKNPKIDFKRLQALTTAKVKELRTDIF